MMDLYNKKDIDLLKEHNNRIEKQKEEIKSLNQIEMDFRKLYNKYSHEQFFSKYYDKETGTLVIKDIGLIFCINIEAVKDSDFQAEIIGDIVLKYMQKEGYYYVSDGLVVITDKGNAYIKGEK